MEMLYEPSVKGLETKISYGTLGIINTFALRANDNPNQKRNILLVNGETIIRNACHVSNTEKQNLEAISNDLLYLRMYYESYLSGESAIVVYFHPLINSNIPEHAQRKETDTRKLIRHLAIMVTRADQLEPNKPKIVAKGDNIKVYGLVVLGMFAYRQLASIIANINLERRKVWLVSHCPFDFFLLDAFPDVEIISSHTGAVITKKDLPRKVFKDENIPFNRATYRVFGDKDFVKPACRNRPKALELLGNAKLKLKTEREIIAFATSKLGIAGKDISWPI
jgi:hypothetical protein